MNFRLPAELREKLKQAADESKRTLTAEIVARLEASFQPFARARPAEFTSAIEMTIQKTLAAVEERGWTPPARTGTLGEPIEADGKKVQGGKK